MEWIAFGTVVALAWWWWRRTRASERRAALEHQVLERNIRLTTCSLDEMKAEIRTLKDRIYRLTASYEDAKTEIATLKTRLITAQATAAQATKKKLPSHQGPATNNETSSETPQRCGCGGEVENCHFCFGSGWVGGGYPKY